VVSGSSCDPVNSKTWSPSISIREKSTVPSYACRETSAVQSVFVAAGFDEIEFSTALKSALEGDQAASRRVAEIAFSIAPRLLVSRGRKISAASGFEDYAKFLQCIASDTRPDFTVAAIQKDLTP